MGMWLKDRLNYLGRRFAGRASWTDKSLDFVPIAYYRGGFDPNIAPLQIYAQVGKSQSEVLMSDGMITQSMDRDYFIFSEDLGFIPEEGDVILDENYCKYYSKVSTRFTRATYTYCNETCVRMRVRTVVIHGGDFVAEVPDAVSTWLRADSMPISQELRQQVP